MMKSEETLQVTTPSDREITMTRVFDAPRKMVFDAFTKPELVKRWLGVRAGWTMPVCEIDLKPGGKYRYVWRSKEGTEMGMGGVYSEVVPNERFVATEIFDDAWYEGDAVDTTTFDEKNGKTRVTTTVRYSSKQIRDSVLKSPMEKGVAQSYDVLADQLAKGL